MRSRLAWLACLLTACGGAVLTACGGAATSATVAYVEPLDGQTGAPVDLPLVVHGAARELPPDYPLGDVLTVVDLDDGGLVPSITDVDGDDLVLSPEVAWPAGHRLAWTFAPPEGVPHGPELSTGAVAGTSVVDLSDHVDVLGIGMDDEGRQCVLLSRPVAGDVDLSFTVDGVPVELSLVPGDTADDWLAVDGDPGPDTRCLDGDPLPIGASLRVWSGDQGPWRFDVEDVAVADIVTALHKSQELAP